MNFFTDLIRGSGSPTGGNDGVRPEDLDAEIAAGAVLVDVREPAETAAGVVPGAICLPLSRLGEGLPMLPPGKKLVVYCKSGMRSDAACQMLRRAGFDARNLTGGYVRWLQVCPR